jgi:chromosome segregation ATPase
MEVDMGRQGMMILFRAQLATVEAEIRAKEAEIASLKAAREAAEAKLEELNHTKRKLKQDQAGHDDERDEQIG